MRMSEETKKTEKKKKPKRVYGRYVVDRPEEECAKSQRVRTILISLADLLLVAMLFIPSEAGQYMAGYEDVYPGVPWLNTLYVVIILTLIVTAVYAAVFSVRSGRFAPEISEKHAPRRGLDSRLTFASFELDFVLRAAWTAVQIYAVVMAFDAGGAVLCVLAAASAGLSFAVRTVTAHFYRGHTVFEPAGTAPPPDPQDEADDFYTVAAAELPPTDGGADTDGGGTENVPAVTEASEDAEDFYGDGQ